MHSLLNTALHHVQYQLRFSHEKKVVTIQIPLVDFTNGNAKLLEDDEWLWNGKMYDVIDSKMAERCLIANVILDTKDFDLHQQEKKQQEKKQHSIENSYISFCASLPSFLFNNALIRFTCQYNIFIESLVENFITVDCLPPNMA